MDDENVELARRETRWPESNLPKPDKANTVLRSHLRILFTYQPDGRRLGWFRKFEEWRTQQLVSDVFWDPNVWRDGKRPAFGADPKQNLRVALLKLVRQGCLIVDGWVPPANDWSRGFQRTVDAERVCNYP